MTAPAQNLSQLAGQPFALIAALDARYGAASTSQQAQQGAAQGGDNWPGLTLRLGEWSLVVPQHDVREVRDIPAYTRVPQAQPWLLGLANVRGDLLAVIDLQQLLSGHAGVRGLDSRLLVFNHPELPVGFVVATVEGKRRFRVDEQCNARLDAAPSQLQPWLLGAFQRGDELRWALGLRKLAQSPQFMKAAA